MPQNINSSVTTLIPKRGKDARRVENLRPISLLNVFYKLITKTLAKRLKNVVGSVIERDQTGFLKGRYIGESVRTVLDVIERCTEEDVNGLICLVIC